MLTLANVLMVLILSSNDDEIATRLALIPLTAAIYADYLIWT